MDKLTVIFATAIFAVAATSLGYFIYREGASQPCATGHIAGNAAIGGDFTLIDHNGNYVSEKDVITGASLIYFGFSYCPDVCPLDLVRNSDAVDLLKKKGYQVTPIFITVDPERDTPDIVAEYIALMHEDMIGLTGDLTMIEKAAKAYKVYFKKNGEGDDYLIDHTSFSYLVDESGFKAFYRRDLSPQELADNIQCVIG